MAKYRCNGVGCEIKLPDTIATYTGTRAGRSSKLDIPVTLNSIYSISIAVITTDVTSLSGCDILKSISANTSNNNAGGVATIRTYIVKATSNTITINCKLVDSQYGSDFIVCSVYEME